MKRYGISRTATLVVALIAGAAAHASGRPLTPQDYYRIQDVSDIEVSADGKQVAYLVSHNDRDANEIQTTL